MKKLAEMRNQEMMCRERALLDTDCGAFWLAKADQWAQQRANDEIASLCRESVGASSTGAETRITADEHSY
jgi:uncharacterized protein YdaU (DUF1376 family)